MDENKKRVLIFIFVLLIVIAIIAFFLSVFIGGNESPSENPNITEEPSVEKTFNVELKELIDPVYYNSLNRTMVQLYSDVSGNSVSLKIFTDEYKEQYAITKDNINSQFTDGDQNVSFRVLDAYYGNKDNNYIFIFNGYIFLDDMDVPSRIIEFKSFVMHVNMNNDFYNIEVISDDTFNNIKTLKMYKTYNVTVGGNYKYQFLNETNLAKLYYNNIKTNIYFNTEYIYGIMDSNTKNKYFNTLEVFQNYANTNFELYNNCNFKNYIKSENTFKIYDTCNNEFVVKHQSLFNFTFDLNFSNY